MSRRTSDDGATSYPFSAAFVIRLTGIGVVAVGLALLLVVGLVALFSLPGTVVTVGVVLAVLAVLALALWARQRAVVVRFDESGYRVRYLRGAGVTAARWREVEDVAAATVAGERCVVLRLRDGRTTTVPVGVLAVGDAQFVHELQERLQRGHGYRAVPRRPA